MIKLICNVLLSIAFSFIFIGCEGVGGGDDETQSVNSTEDSTTVSDAIPDPGSTASCGDVNVPVDFSIDNSTTEPEEEEESEEDFSQLFRVNTALNKAVKELNAEGLGFITNIKLKKDRVIVAGCNNVVVIDNSSTSSTTSGDTNS